MTHKNSASKYDFAKYKNRLPAYLKAKGIETGPGNIRCFIPGHDDSTESLNIRAETAHCFGCGFHGDVYDIAGVLIDSDSKSAQFREVAATFGDAAGDGGGDAGIQGGIAGSWKPPTTEEPPDPIDPEAMQKILLYLREIRKDNAESIAEFCRARGYQDPAYGRYLAWWPGWGIAARDLSPEVLAGAGIPSPSWTSPGVVCRFERGLKLQYIARDGKTAKRGSHGSRVFPYPDLPDSATTETVVLVEGELDALSCRYAGIDTAVSIGGTSGLSVDDAKRLHPYRRVVLLLDNDEPGKIASGELPKPDGQKWRKTIPEILASSGYLGKVARATYATGDAKDPDEMVKVGKAERLKEIIATAENIAEEKSEEEREDEKPQDRGEAVSVSKQDKTAENVEHPAESETGGGGEKHEEVESLGGGNSRETSGGGDDNEITPPFQFLGFDDKKYYTLPKNQNIPITIDRGEAAFKNHMNEIATPDWWFEHFNCLKKIGDEFFQVTDVKKAAEWFRENERQKGIYNDENLLGIGAHFEGSEIVLNTGKTLLDRSGRVTKYEEYTGENVYCRSKINFDVSATPWTKEDGAQFFRELSTFSFERTIHYLSVAGFCAVAPFASILRRRPHIWITGKKGLGKSWLIEDLIYPVLGEKLTNYKEGLTTEAAIRQVLRKDSRPVIIDEFEANKADDKITIQNVLKLARSAYGGRDLDKGSSSQKAISFTTKMMFCFASVNVNIENEADRSRISICRMKKSVGKMREIKNPGGLRSRIWQRLPALLENIELAKKMILEKVTPEGEPAYDNRTADTYAPLLAGFWTIMSDNPFCTNDPENEYLIRDAISELGLTDKQEDEEKILERILQERIRIAPDQERTVSEMLTEANALHVLEHDGILQRMGLRRYEPRSDGLEEVLAISQNHPSIKKILAETPFANYREVLRRHPAKVKDAHAVRMMGGKAETCILLDWKKIEKMYYLKDEGGKGECPKAAT